MSNEVSTFAPAWSWSTGCGGSSTDPDKTVNVYEAQVLDSNIGDVDGAKGLGDYLRELAENAVIRAGDFPRERGSVDVTILFSQLAFVQKIRDYYDRASAFAMTQKDRLKETTGRLRDMEDAAKGLPSLI